ncbi:MAG TPA: FeoB-associated Cys-rich membrane protein [Candidatus Methanomethylophilaceae archaeon]|nr:FeoB-associated Cys-rich membrane protein [Candidatus Methanomethylophilaceae archaeon]
MNIATILVGAVVIAILAVAVYYTARSFGKGDCSGCSNRDKCNKKP